MGNFNGRYKLDQVISHSVVETSFPQNQTKTLVFVSLLTQDELDVGTLEATWTISNMTKATFNMSRVVPITGWIFGAMDTEATYSFSSSPPDNNKEIDLLDRTMKHEVGRMTVTTDVENSDWLGESK